MRKLKIFSTPWHVAHQYELVKLDNVEFYYLVNHNRNWSEKARPMPEYLNWVPYFEKGKYDLAVLHIDQQCLLEPKLGKRVLFDQMKEVIKEEDDIPIIVVNHGSTCYPEKFPFMVQREKAIADGIDIDDPDEKRKLDNYDVTIEEGEKWARNKMQEILSDVDAVVCNAKQAEEEWGIGRAIIHGMDPAEWWNLSKEPRGVTFISPGGMGEKYYGRSLFGYTRNELKERYDIRHMWIAEDVSIGSWDDYRRYLGRSLVYFNPTLGSPMPRARTEAMFSGCCMVTTRHYDISEYIKDGVDGFIVNDNPEDAAEKINWCIENYNKAARIGNRGRKTAEKYFHIDRFLNEWKNLIEEVLGEKVWNK